MKTKTCKRHTLTITDNLDWYECLICGEFVRREARPYDLEASLND